MVKTVHTTEIEKPVTFKLKRAGCPVEKIPKFSGRGYYCEIEGEVVYNLPDGTPCCRKGVTPCCRKGTGKPQKLIPYKEKQPLGKPTTKTIVKNNTDVTVIYNPRTKRWVDIDGPTGKQVLAGYYQ